MVMRPITRREFVSWGAAAVGTFASQVCLNAGQQGRNSSKPPRSSILNFNENMEYRRLGKTNLWVSAVCLGGHWKRIDKVVPGATGCGYCDVDKNTVTNPAFIKNRDAVVSRCIEVGINYIDACAYHEVLAYAKVLKGRREKMYLGYSNAEREPRNKEYRSVNRLIESLDESLKMFGLDYVDVWRMTLPQDGLPDLSELTRIEEAAFGAMEKARKQGKVRFSGISTHNRPWLKSVIEQYPDQLQVACTPYTANTKELPGDSVFRAIRKFDVGVFGIKPFADNSLFKGDSSPDGPHREEDNRRAALAIRYILGNPAITAPIPGLLNAAQVDNVAKAVMERRKLDPSEAAELENASSQMWANLRPSHQWLKNWEYA
jgi:aryl-alcohol dehydrogenase-like predicted oxidoreductase